MRRTLTAEELNVLDGLDRAKRFIEKQCEIEQPTREQFRQALESIANLWPIDTTAKIDAVYGINDGRSRAIIAEGAITIARKALGIEKMP